MHSLKDLIISRRLVVMQSESTQLLNPSYGFPKFTLKAPVALFTISCNNIIHLGTNLPVVALSWRLTLSTTIEVYNSTNDFQCIRRLCLNIFSFLPSSSDLFSLVRNSSRFFAPYLIDYLFGQLFACQTINCLSAEVINQDKWHIGMCCDTHCARIIPHTRAVEYMLHFFCKRDMKILFVLYAYVFW